MDDGTKIGENKKPLTPSPTSTSESGNEEANNTRITKNQPLNFDDGKPMKDSTDDERSVIAESLDVSDASDVTEKCDWSEEKRLPSLEVTNHSDCTDNEEISDAESGINLLSAIIEEKSPDSSTSELIDTKYKEIDDKENQQNLLEMLESKDAPTMTLEATHDAATGGCVKTQEERAQTEGQADKSDKIIKENEILTSRIKEINEQLLKANKEILDLRRNLAEYQGDDELKNPVILLNKLTAQKAENDDLKQQLVRQTEMIDSAETTQRELSDRVKKLMTEEKAKSEKINQKQEAVDKLETKVAKLASVIQSMTADKDDDNDDDVTVNGLMPVTALDTSEINSTRSLERRSTTHTYSRPTKRSRICTIL